MHITLKKFLGFPFRKVGQFALSQHSYKKWLLPTIVKLDNDADLLATNGCYVICLGDAYCDSNILYVGYYSGTLQQRGLRRNSVSGEYMSWHSDNIDDNINKILKIIQGIPCNDKAWKGAPGKRNNFDSTIRAFINKVMSAGQLPEISLWLIENPIVKLADVGISLNISAAIERHFLDSTLVLPLNTVGNTRKKIPVVETQN